MTDLTAIPQDAWVLAILMFLLGGCAGVVWWAIVMDRVDPQPKRRSTLWGLAKAAKVRSPQPKHPTTGKYMTRAAYAEMMGGGQVPSGPGFRLGLRHIKL